MAFRDLPIRKKLMIILMGISGAVLLITSASFMIYEWVTFRRSLITNVSTLAEIIADNSTASLAFRNEEDAAKVLSALKAEKNIVAAALYDREGRIFARYPREMSEGFPHAPQSPGHYFEKGYLILFRDVSEAGVRQGALFLKSDLAVLQRRFQLYAGIVVLVMFFSIIIAFVLSSQLQRGISRPILTLTGTARKVSEKRDYSVRAEKVSDDEIGELTTAFNHMLTQIQERDAALRESEERLNLALKASGIGTWSWEVVKNKLIWDDYMYPLFGLQPGSSIESFEDFIARVHPEDRERVQSEVQNALANLSNFSSEFRVVWPDGSRHIVASMGRPYTDETAKLMRFTGVCFDITQRKRAERALRETAEELARSNAELQQFAYVASHDLQEPLRAVAGCVQILQKRYHGKLDKHADELILHTVDGSKRMQNLIQDLLTYSRLGTRMVVFELHDTERILQEVLANLRRRIQETGAIIHHDPLPTVQVDPTQTTQLLQNLIANALKFNKRTTPEIHIGAKRQNDEWLFWVRDNGIGIEPEYIDRIFLVFQRLHTRKEYPGTGIGLAICKKIVERRGGKIWVESQPGHGSTFYFTIPDLR